MLLVCVASPDMWGIVGARDRTGNPRPVLCTDAYTLGMNMNGQRINHKSGDTWRLFIAVPLPEPVREVVEGAHDELRRHDWPVKWVDPALAHITLKFLGDTKPGSVAAIERALERVATGSVAASAASGSLGAFPGLHRPRVIWLGLDGDTTPMIEMARDVDDALEPLGFDREQRPFRPHITLGRVRRNTPPPADVEQMAGQLDTPGCTVSFDRLRLVRSVLGNDGPAYTTLAEWTIGAPPDTNEEDPVELAEHG